MNFFQWLWKYEIKESYYFRNRWIGCIIMYVIWLCNITSQPLTVTDIQIFYQFTNTLLLLTMIWFWFKQLELVKSWLTIDEISLTVLCYISYLSLSVQPLIWHTCKRTSMVSRNSTYSKFTNTREGKICYQNEIYAHNQNWVDGDLW